jgi:restriction system protein
VIWQFAGTLESLNEQIISREDCIFCLSPMDVILRTVSGIGPNQRIRTCPCCGWWNHWMQTQSVIVDAFGRPRDWSLYGAAAQLRVFDPADLTQPIDEVRTYLLAKYESRFSLHPRLLEQTVGSVFASIGFDVVVTSYSADGGIDVIVTDADGMTTGVQVKRTSRPIEVEQLHALTGALVQRGLTKGVFVTTSKFRSGVPKAAVALATRGYCIELLDAPRFFAALKLTQRQPYASFEEWEEAFGDPELQTIYKDEPAEEYNEDAW